jgi:hypothetical protein
MKRYLLAVITLAFSFTSHAQLNPVSWNFTIVKTGEKTYEFRAKATIQDGWHLYSQAQPDDAIAIPTGFSLHPNPVLILDGKFKEVGKLEKFHDKKLDLSANQYSNSVDFVQVVKLKANVKTNISGSVEFQTCNDEKCLPPKTVNFSVAVK